MEYKLPKISERLNSQVDRWYAKSTKKDSNYVSMLFVRYMQQNPLLLSPIKTLPEEVAKYTQGVILTTLRKFEKQFKSQGKKLPKVKKESIDSFIGGIQTKEQSHSLQLAIRYAEENEALCISVQEHSQQVKPTLRGHIQFPFIYTLALLENQGNADELNKKLMSA